MSTTTLIIGVGNSYRGDDAVGLLVARQLQAYAGAAQVLEASGEGAALMHMWEDAQAVFLIDATVSGAEPGTIHRLDAHAQPIPADFFHYSTHDFGVAEAIEMARVLDQLPPRLVVYGIEGQQFNFGDALSPAVEQALHTVVEQVRHELEQSKV